MPEEPTPAPKTLGNAEHAADPGYAKQLAEAEKSGICKFCTGPGGIHTCKNPPIGSWKYWHFKLNDFPHKHFRHHFVIVLKEHKTMLSQLIPEEFAELLLILQWAQVEYKIPGGMQSFRFDNFDYSGGTMAHIHVQLQVPDHTGPAVATMWLPPVLRTLLHAGKSIWSSVWTPPALPPPTP